MYFHKFIVTLAISLTILGCGGTQPVSRDQVQCGVSAAASPAPIIPARQIAFDAASGWTAWQADGPIVVRSPTGDEFAVAHSESAALSSVGLIDAEPAVSFRRVLTNEACWQPVREQESVCVAAAAGHSIDAWIVALPETPLLISGSEGGARLVDANTPDGSGRRLGGALVAAPRSVAGLVVAPVRDEAGVSTRLIAITPDTTRSHDVIGSITAVEMGVDAQGAVRFAWGGVGPGGAYVGTGQIDTDPALRLAGIGQHPVEDPLTSIAVGPSGTWAWTAGGQLFVGDPDDPHRIRAAFGTHGLSRSIARTSALLWLLRTSEEVGEYVSISCGE